MLIVRVNVFLMPIFYLTYLLVRHLVVYLVGYLVGYLISPIA